MLASAKPLESAGCEVIGQAEHNPRQVEKLHDRGDLLLLKWKNRDLIRKILE
jgi:hypothetical protein